MYCIGCRLVRRGSDCTRISVIEAAARTRLVTDWSEGIGNGEKVLAGRSQARGAVGGFGLNSPIGIRNGLGLAM